ncbi:MAG TPA: hypothetical protein VGN23_07055 [Verrucomicrobiae bacterium]
MSMGAVALSEFALMLPVEGQQDIVSKTNTKDSVTPREMLKSLLLTKAEVEQWLAEKAFPFAKYNSELGWLLRSGLAGDGIDQSTCIYTFGALDERITINYRDRPCRINTYGNSFTQCHQVSDGETWQEIMAAHLQEPVRNFGVGGWSVYQAYLRMLKEEERAPADFIIFNIYDDDHFRNLDSWRSIRMPRHPQFIEPTLPYVTVNIQEQSFEERPNPCPTPESVFNLTDLDWVVNQFKDDFVLQIMLAHANASTPNTRQKYTDLMKLATTIGIVTRIDTEEKFSQAADEAFKQAAFFATERIVENVEAYAKKANKRVLYVLSYPATYIARFISEDSRSDQEFLDFLVKRGLPTVDLAKAHQAGFMHFKGDLKDYLTQYFIGHYNPSGNFFCANAIMAKLAEMLDPKPVPYRVGSAQW